MRETEPMVTVYSFQIFDGGERPRLATFKATRETILADHTRALILEGTAEPVPLRALDGEGHYRRVATGWGEL